MAPNHEAVAHRFDRRSLDHVEVVYTENPLDLSEVSCSHPYKARYDFWDELFIRKRTPPGIQH